MPQIVDAAARLSAAAVKAAGFVGVARYVAPWMNGAPNPKCITVAELADDFAHGLAVVIVFEQGATNCLGGAAQGRADGKVAVDACRALGLAPGGIIYAAVDYNAPTSDWPTIAAYLDAFRTECHGAGFRQGGYGRYGLGAQMLADGHAEGWWESGAWSGTQYLKGMPGADLYQRIQACDVGGAQCDVNDVWNDDFGQWPRPTTEENMATSAATIHVDHTTGKGWAVINGVPNGSFRGVFAVAASDGSIAKVGPGPKPAVDGDLVVNADLGTPTLVDVDVDVIVVHV